MRERREATMIEFKPRFFILPAIAITVLAMLAKFNEEMVKAGVMLDGAGLRPSSQGARIRFTGDKRSVIDGPFAETKELIAGYWIIQVKSKAEAIEWMKRCPKPHDEDC